MSKNAVVAKWQDMTSAMKRIVVHTALMTALSAVVLVFLVVPAIRENARLAGEFAVVGESFNATHMKISSMGVQKETTAATEQQLKTLVDSGVLVPLLGSLEMRAMSILAPLASTTGVMIAGDGVKGMAQRPIWDPASVRGRVYARQPIEFSGLGTYEQIIALIKEIEDKLPMATLSSLRIVSQSRTPEVHAMMMSLEWPISVEKKTGKDALPPGTSGAPK